MIGAPGIPVPPVTPPVTKPVTRLANIFLGPVYCLPNIITRVVNKTTEPITFFVVLGSVSTKKDKPTKTDKEPATATGTTSFQSTLLRAFGRIAAAPRMYTGVIIPTAVIGPNRITKIGTETVQPPNPEYPWIEPLINNMKVDINNSVMVTSEKILII